jgi:predicted phage terminase large subunit-like protein
LQTEDHALPSPPTTAETERETLARLAKAALARRELVPFAELMDPRYERAAHIDLLCAKLEALERGEVDKIIVCMPPRHSKSKTAAQDFVAWYLGRHPDHQVILASYAAELAEGHARRVRDMIRDERFPFDVRIDETSAAVGRFSTTAGGLVRSAGVGGALTGFGAHLLVIDDAVRGIEDADSAPIRESVWDWYSSVARTRLMPNAKQVVIGTRWHAEDILGRLLELPGWERLILPALAEEGDALGRREGEALWPKWYPADKMPSVASGEISSRLFSALYQQAPSPASGLYFHSDWFHHRWSVLPTTCFDSRDATSSVLAVDCASKTGIQNDPIALVYAVYDRQSSYIADIIRRMEFSELARTIVEMAARWKPQRVVIEEASSGIPIVQELRRLTNLPIIGVPPRGSKVARAESVTAQFESGRVLLPERAPWIDDFISEFLAFDRGKHDDQVDATSLALSTLLGVEENWLLSGLV